ncbi:MAG TPA: glycogen debranching protein GlgX, partial [Xanthomonadales bacterium]|nr:glycogen debranching protein GlgX [Xanthomonadales bacterium]
ELCLFDAQHHEIGRHPLFESPGHNWHGYLPGCWAGQIYGYRVHGPWDPDRGLRFNPAKLLLDPYARLLSGQFQWSEAVFDYVPGVAATHGWQLSHLDSAPYVQKAVVVDAMPGERATARAVPWSETILYECNVRGYTLRFPGLDEQQRGRFAGLAHKQVLAWVKALGITSIELQPVQAFVDEMFLYQRGLRNFWGYNTLAFFAPEPRYAGSSPITEFRDMVNAIHDAGLEVILDVAFNHTAESDALGPTLSFRGIDNLSWYRTEAGDRGVYINDTGCGNTLYADHPKAQELVVDVLRYWSQDMGVDGFRFDLATILGRTGEGFRTDHPLLQRISQEAELQAVKLIAEPWDPGPGGYQLGQFPPPWAEWNDRFRDVLRQFWRGPENGAGQGLDQVARCLHGSSDLFEASGRAPWSSINFVTSHDGFTLSDLVSYASKHNEANGEANRDGHAHNFSSNHGVEGPSNAPAILAARRQHRLNLLASLLLSQGTPMMLAGDEFGQSQAGNNNAYAQDNETTWLDWSLRNADAEFSDSVRALIALRRNWGLFRQAHYVHDDPAPGRAGISWYHPDGSSFTGEDWKHATALMWVL